jgi:rhamnulokinase
MILALPTLLKKEVVCLYYLAIDIGASSGRHIVGWIEDGQMQTQEVYRFPNGVETAGGHLVWNVQKLFSDVLIGIEKAFSMYPEIKSLSIDTWGVDYVLMQGDKSYGKKSISKITKV